VFSTQDNGVEATVIRTGDELRASRDGRVAIDPMAAISVAFQNPEAAQRGVIAVVALNLRCRDWRRRE
jgi:hypothetical protein